MLLKFSPILFAFFLMFSFEAFSDVENPTNAFELTVNIKEKIDKILEISGKDYEQKIEIFREDLETYILYKKKVCHGEFSALILSDIDSIDDISAEDEKKVSTLSKEERDLCFKELKALHITYIKNTFVARKKYLNYVHETSLKELELAKDQAIKSISASFTNTKSKKRKK